MHSAAKRNRSGNFDQDDVELFLSLVNDQKALIESGKQDDKKKGWDLIHDGFNQNCTGIKRDVGALKMKLKNLRAQNKKQKLADAGLTADPSENNHNSEQDDSMVDGTDSEQKTKVPRKRTKMFSSEETNLLQELVEKHLHNLDTSLTRDSIETRNKAWDIITEEFNWAQVNNIPRDQLELKTKLKNLKAQRVNCKTESTENESAVMSVVDTDTTTVEERKLRAKFPIRSSLPAPTSILTRPKKSNEAILDSLDPDWDSDDDEDYVLPVRKTYASVVTSKPVPQSDDREMERVRKENLLLKNAVLRKKERLLELQIALAERNLRRHQL